MKIVFMGTPEFARAPLAQLCGSKHEVLAVVTGPDQKTGRGQKLLPTACRQEADRRDLQVFTPVGLKDPGLFRSLKALDPDLFVVCAFRILPKRLFSLPKYGSINIHTSWLPKYRGAAPINWALINGEKETGLTSFLLNETVDTGSIILQERVEIFEDDNFDTLSTRMSELSGPFLLKTLDLIEGGDFRVIPQNESEATRAPKIGPMDAMIDFGFPARNVINFVRGMATKPGAYTYHREKKLKVHACRLADSASEPGTRPGTILTSRKKLLVQCDGSAVELLRVVPQGKREIDGLSYLNGYRLQPGEVLGEVSQGVKE